MSVSAIIVTRGDVELDAISESLPDDWEKITWDNGRGECRVDWPHPKGSFGIHPAKDLLVYGRFAAIEYASGDLIYVQDDDCIVSDPQALVDAWQYEAENRAGTDDGGEDRLYLPHVVCNMPANFRARHFYDEHSLIGFGGVFQRDAPKRAFDRFLNYYEGKVNEEHFHRTCDMVFTGLTPRVLVDIEYTDMPWASADNRMWRQPWHQQVRNEMLDMILRVRDNA